MNYIRESRKSPAQIVEALPEIAAKHKFGVLGTHNLRQKMAEKDIEFGQECLIVEICSPLQAKKILEGNMGISTVLPCRISVFQEGGKTKVATMRPTILLELFPNPELQPVAKEVEKALCRMIDEVI